MKIVFFGTPEYVLPVLASLHKKFKSKSGESPIVAVVTQNPKPVGRKKVLTYSPIDRWAFKRKLPIFYNSYDFYDSKIQADIGVLASYGEILPEKVLNYFPKGILNIHPSLLPKFRGSSPVQGTIVTGEKETGISVIKLDEELDHGPIVAQYKEGILAGDTIETLRNRLYEKSAEVLPSLLEAYLKGKIKLRVQNHKEATFTRQITKKDAFIPPFFINKLIQIVSNSIISSRFGTFRITFIKNGKIKANAELIERFIRAMQPWPQAWTLLRLSSSGQAKRLKLLKAHLEIEKRNNQSMKKRVTTLVLDEVQLEGKTSVSWQQFKSGYPQAKFA